MSSGEGVGRRWWSLDGLEEYVYCYLHEEHGRAMSVLAQGHRLRSKVRRWTRETLDQEVEGQTTTTTTNASGYVLGQDARRYNTSLLYHLQDTRHDVTLIAVNDSLHGCHPCLSCYKHMRHRHEKQEESDRNCDHSDIEAIEGDISVDGRRFSRECTNSCHHGCPFTGHHRGQALHPGRCSCYHGDCCLSCRRKDRAKEKSPWRLDKENIGCLHRRYV